MSRDRCWQLRQPSVREILVRNKVESYCRGIYRRLARPTIYKLMGRHDMFQSSVVISFPASGRTWLMVMLEMLGLSLRYTHDGTGHRAKRYQHELDHDGSAYHRMKIILLVRDPRDVVVSGFFEASKRLPGARADQRFEGTLQEFVRDPRHGIEKIVRFYEVWDRIVKRDDNDILLIMYEDMKKNVAHELRRILHFLEIHTISERQISDAVEGASFENMKRKEARGTFSNQYGGLLTPGDPDDPESFKTRKGKVGGHTEYLTDEDLFYCNRVMSTCPWYATRQ